jgi:hypothetical protein
MIAGLPHAVKRTLATFDQLGTMWGRGVILNLTLHGLSHEQIHRLGGEQLVFRDGYADDRAYVASTRIATPMGWTIGVFGEADLTCDQCRALTIPEADLREVLQRAGIDAGGMGGAQ